MRKQALVTSKKPERPIRTLLGKWVADQRASRNLRRFNRGTTGNNRDSPQRIVEVSIFCLPYCDETQVRNRPMVSLLRSEKESRCQIRPSKPESKHRKTLIKPSRPESKPSKPESKHRKMPIKPSKPESKHNKQQSKLRRSWAS